MWPRMVSLQSMRPSSFCAPSTSRQLRLLSYKHPQGPGFSGNYKGAQSKSNAIFALLETIASDFDRTLRTTEESEHNAHREFVAFDQSSQSSIAAKTTKKELDTQDLKTTRTSIKTKTDDMQTAVGGH